MGLFLKLLTRNFRNIHFIEMHIGELLVNGRRAKLADRPIDIQYTSRGKGRGMGFVVPCASPVLL